MDIGASALGVALGLAVVVSIEISLPSTAAAAAPSGLAPSQGNAELTADVLTADGLRYLGQASVTTPNGPVEVLQFAFDGATASGLTLRSACSDGLALVDAGTGTVTMAGSSIAAASLSAVVGGVPVTFTAAAPPTAPFPATVELDQLRIDVTSLSSGRVALPGLAVGTVAC